MQKKALITGITGQDGSYLAELLLEKGYEVHGIVRRVAVENQEYRLARIDHLQNKITLHPASLESLSSLTRVFYEVQPDECYHLAAQSFVAESFKDEYSVILTNVTGTHHVLTALKDEVPLCKFYFAGSSEMFGRVVETPQTEKTPFHPRSPYGISKVTGFDLTRYYREAHGIFACSGILFNHESPRRGLEFVTRKITNAVARIKQGLQSELRLGNTSACRDWGFAGDYVEAMWLMLQRAVPDDYVVATGATHSVQEFVESAFCEVGLDWRLYVVADESFKRPADVEFLCGDASYAEKTLGWKPKVGFRELVSMMINADLRRYQKNIEP